MREEISERTDLRLSLIHILRKVKAAVQGKVKVVAQGNIDSVSKCRELLDAGADYISSEFAADILRSWE